VNSIIIAYASFCTLHKQFESSKNKRPKAFICPSKEVQVRKKCPSHGKAKYKIAPPKTNVTRGVSHCGLALYIKKYVS
jgi:hypothetical protein